MPGTEFVRRFLLHVLPTGSKRIRHYGVLDSSSKRVKLRAARMPVRHDVDWLQLPQARS